MEVDHLTFEKYSWFDRRVVEMYAFASSPDVPIIYRRLQSNNADRNQSTDSRASAASGNSKAKTQTQIKQTPSYNDAPHRRCPGAIDALPRDENREAARNSNELPQIVYPHQVVVIRCCPKHNTVRTTFLPPPRSKSDPGSATPHKSISLAEVGTVPLRRSYSTSDASPGCIRLRRL
ncbi:hypothetical protein IQ06DRAFT_308542 [Phaeosphaeriaceae sp. SRC1lsM3a]|nr:hypothetical protein IQ06DRAFT_308542 [Stagonospora sp. SRC1lsM3a]